jgi:hypothetical protein
MTWRGKLAIAAGVLALIGAALAVFVFEVQTAFIDVKVDEPFDVSPQMTLLAHVTFHPVVHQGTGTAEIYKDGGACVLRLSSFQIDNGPALRLRLVDLDDAKDSDSVSAAAYIDLGPLKGNIGQQVYTLPTSFDPSKHRSLVVWCERFAVNFVTAPIAPVEG